MEKDFELLQHTADIKIRVFGKTIEELFKNALIGMFQAIGPQSDECKRFSGRVICQSLPITHKVDVSGYGLPTLLVDFLSEALYLADANKEAYLDCTIHSISEERVQATLYGVAITGYDSVEIKAVTYNELVVKESAAGWYADVVFDI